MYFRIFPVFKVLKCNRHPANIISKASDNAIEMPNLQQRFTIYQIPKKKPEELEGKRSTLSVVKICSLFTRKEVFHLQFKLIVLDSS